MKTLIFRLLFGAEWRELQRVRALSRPARFQLEGGLDERTIRRRLAGAGDNAVLKAVMAVVDRKIVSMSDRATNPPSEVNTPELRTYEAGGANAITELKTELQALVEATPEEDKAS